MAVNNPIKPWRRSVDGAYAILYGPKWGQNQPSWPYGHISTASVTQRQESSMRFLLTDSTSVNSNGGFALLARRTLTVDGRFAENKSTLLAQGFKQKGTSEYYEGHGYLIRLHENGDPEISVLSDYNGSYFGIVRSEDKEKRPTLILYSDSKIGVLYKELKRSGSTSDSVAPGDLAAVEALTLKPVAEQLAALGSETLPGSQGRGSYLTWVLELFLFQRMGMKSFVRPKMTLRPLFNSMFCALIRWESYKNHDRFRSVFLRSPPAVTS